jgi:hypothetical protein
LPKLASQPVDECSEKREAIANPVDFDAALDDDATEFKRKFIRSLREHKALALFVEHGDLLKAAQELLNQRFGLRSKTKCLMTGHVLFNVL